MKKSNLLISASAALVALIAVSGIAMSTFAADNDSEASGRPPMAGMRGGLMFASEEAKAALEAGDYEAWKAAMPENCPLLEKINEENFSRLAEAGSLIKQAGKIYEELGLNGPGRGVGPGKWRIKGFDKSLRHEKKEGCPHDIEQ